MGKIEHGTDASKTRTDIAHTSGDCTTGCYEIFGEESHDQTTYGKNNHI